MHLADTPTGQVRLPWYGAIVTGSLYGKQFEAGRYNLDQTILYVSRGIGLEGAGAPRVRFLCPQRLPFGNSLAATSSQPTINAKSGSSPRTAFFLASLYGAVKEADRIPILILAHFQYMQPPIGWLAAVCCDLYRLPAPAQAAHTLRRQSQPRISPVTALNPR